MAGLGRIWRRWGVIALLVLLLSGLGAGRAIASVHEYPLDPPGAGRVMFRSLQPLRDREDRTWQVVLLTEGDGQQVTAVRLRLSAFPGTVVDRDRPLQVASGGQSWSLADDFALAATSPNVGEYDLMAALGTMDSRAPLTLTVPLVVGDRAIATTIPVPPFAVGEWFKMLDQATGQG